MSTAKMIAKNTAILWAANLISMALGFAINIFIARQYPVNEYGIINDAINLATLFNVAFDLGIGVFMTVDLARRPELLRSYVNNAIAVKLILITLAFFGIVGYAWLFHYEGTKLLVVYIIGVYLMLMGLCAIFQAVFQAFQTMEHISMSQLINASILLAGAILVNYLNLSIVAYAVIYLASGATILLYYLIVVMRTHYCPFPAFDLGTWKHLIYSGIPFSIGSFFAFIYFRIDIQILDAMMGSVAVGYYSAAYKLVEAIIVIPSMFCTAVFPVISLYFHRKDRNLNVLLEKSIKYLYLIGLPIVVGAILLADKFIVLIYQEKFMESIGVLQVLSLGLLIMMVNYIPSSFMSATNMQKAYIKLHILCSVVNIALNIAIIPYYGVIGSASTMVVTQLLMGGVTYYLVSRAGYSYPNRFDVLRITLCGLAMGVLVYFLHDLNIVLVVAAGAVVYSVLVLLSGSLSKDDLSLLKSVMKKENPEVNPADRPQ